MFHLPAGCQIEAYTKIGDAVQTPALTTHITFTVPVLSTTNTSVWLSPSCCDAATGAPAGKIPAGAIAPGPCQAPALSTHITCKVPFLSTMNTSVWLSPNCCDAAIRAPGVKSPLVPIAPGACP